ncbi:MAG: DUF488 family protein [Clostridia bacterium]|nr:DUF488 family protein [Clostridia bacterium]
MQIFTGCYSKCKVGNKISISGDRGKKVEFVGKTIPQLAPKKAFWEIWHNNIGKVPELENNKYYITQYYNEVLTKVDFEQLFKDEQRCILLCYEDSSEFCHRHIVAEYIEFIYNIKVPEIEIDENYIIKEKTRPAYIKEILQELLIKSN